MFGLALPEWLTIIALVASVPLTLKMMGRASAAYERKAAERAQAAEGAGSSSGGPEASELSGDRKEET